MDDKTRNPAFGNDFNIERFVESAARTICAVPGTVPYDIKIIRRPKDDEKNSA